MGTPGLFGVPGLLGKPGLFVKACVLDGDFLVLEFGLFGLTLGSSLLIGAPTSSGEFLILGLFKFLLDRLLLNLFDDCGICLKELLFLLAFVSLLEIVKFLGFSIS